MLNNITGNEIAPGAPGDDDLLRPLIETEFAGRIALVSSFGAEAAVLLHRVAQIDPAVPVIFLDTGKMFGETLRYREVLIERFGLTDVRSIRPLPETEASQDSKGTLWLTRPDACCHFRKVEPLQRALKGFDAWISGRKRYHGGGRATLPLREENGGQVKINAMADWDRDRVDGYYAAFDLPPHPLVAEGYASIGCLPCTARTGARDDQRAGRWQGMDKTECGIHAPVDSLGSDSVAMIAKTP